MVQPQLDWGTIPTIFCSSMVWLEEHAISFVSSFENVWLSDKWWKLADKKYRDRHQTWTNPWATGSNMGNWIHFFLVIPLCWLVGCWDKFKSLSRHASWRFHQKSQAWKNKRRGSAVLLNIYCEFAVYPHAIHRIRPANAHGRRYMKSTVTSEGLEAAMCSEQLKHAKVEQVREHAFIFWGWGCWILSSLVLLWWKVQTPHPYQPKVFPHITRKTNPNPMTYWLAGSSPAKCMLVHGPWRSSKKRWNFNPPTTCHGFTAHLLNRINIIIDNYIWNTPHYRICPNLLVLFPFLILSWSSQSPAESKI